MSDRQATFVEQCLDGSVDPSQIDDFIDQWHAGQDERPIETFLGFTSEEYARWVEEPWTLRYILFSRKMGRPFEESLAVAARSEDPQEADVLKGWLRRTKRI